MIGKNKGSMDRKRAIKQLLAIKKYGKSTRLAAERWDKDWKTLIAILMSARTTDKKTIPVAESLFLRYGSINKLARAKIRDIREIIRPVNFYKTKSKNISNLSKILIREYKGKVPHDFSKLIDLPGVGRKTANVFLAEHGHGEIGADTHVSWISKQMGWTTSEKQEKIEEDLKKLFSRRYWREINYILVRFGQTYRSRREKIRILKGIKLLK
jgi:endonuclease III